MNERPTPETDAAAWEEGGDQCEIVPADFARNLERQRDDLLEALVGLLSQSSLNDTYEPLVAAWARALAVIGRVKGGAE